MKSTSVLFSFYSHHIPFAIQRDFLLWGYVEKNIQDNTKIKNIFFNFDEESMMICPMLKY